jgi:glycosyltransferase involved in cell wall biosynthesis
MTNSVVSPSRLPKPNLSVSVVIPTRNRSTHAEACAKSILATDGFVDLIVVDQSDDRATAVALNNIADPRVRYYSSDTRGVTKGRNLGMSMSGSDIIAFTDDDCRVSADWIEKIKEIFASDLEVAVVCGRVCVPAEIQQLGYAEGFEPQRRVWQSEYPPLGRDWGLTANFSVRRAVLDKVGDFDPLLGAGAPLRAGEEPDFLFRVLRGGFKVVNAKEVVVDHYGIRKPGEEFRKLIMGYGAGTAAAMFKHVRLHDYDGIKVYLQFLVSTLIMVSGNVLHRRRPTGANYLIAFMSGTFASLKFAVDRKRRQYVERST